MTDKSESLKRNTSVMRGRPLLKGLPMMLISLVVVLVVVPMTFMIIGRISDFVASQGVTLAGNINDGTAIAEFSDPANDILRTIPSGKQYKEAARALDIRKFAVKRVKFHPLSGMGIQPRLNLVFYFDGILPNPMGSKHGFSLPVIHVYIKTPSKSVRQITSDKTAAVHFDKQGWNIQVVVDGLHDQARMYDEAGQSLGEGLGIYVKYLDKAKGDTEGEGTKLDVIKDEKSDKSSQKITRITAALPMEVIGDPSRGEWLYYVAVGLADLRSPSMFYPARNDKDSEIFDMLEPGPPEINSGVQGKPILLPVKVEKGK